jgi:predicted ester cyclase
MEEERNRELARRWFEDLWSKADLSVADEIIDPSYAPDWIQIDATGPAQVKHELKYFRSVFPDLVYDMVDVVTQSNRIWVRYKGTGTQHGAAWGFAPTGRTVEFEGVTILYVSQDGKITDRWGAFSMYDILVDLGLVPRVWELSAHIGHGGDS